MRFDVTLKHPISSKEALIEYCIVYLPNENNLLCNKQTSAYVFISANTLHVQQSQVLKAPKK